MKKRSVFLLMSITGIAFLVQGCSGSASPTKSPTPTLDIPPTVTRAQTPTASVPQTALLSSTGEPVQTESYQDWPIAILEPFDIDSGGWFTGKHEDGNAAVDVSITDGKYLVKVTAHQPGIWCSLTQGQSFRNFYFSIEIERRIGPEKADYGLAFRASQTDFIFYIINAEAQQYMAGKYAGNTRDRIIPWKYSEHINATGYNQIGVLALGPKIILVANGEDLDSFEDPAPKKRRGGCGFWTVQPRRLYGARF